jgi:parvulin-like peptidyl-prolyl isomerase
LIGMARSLIIGPHDESSCMPRRAAVMSSSWWRGSWMRGAQAREMFGAVAIVGVCIAIRFVGSGSSADANPFAGNGRGGNQPVAAAGTAELPPGARPVALVNGAEVTRDQLAAECLSRHGMAVLETLVNRAIIEQACRRAGMAVTAQDVEAEVDAMSKRFNVPREKWIELIKQERGVTPKQYAEDIVWPMIALRRLAAAAVEPTAEEIQEAFEKQFGPAVKARIIVLRSREEAEKVHAQAVAAPGEFPALARQHSVDVASASANGWVQPIRLHSGEPQFDRAAFALEPGQISTVVQVADQFIIIKCEGHLPADTVPVADVQGKLAAEIRERKSRQASTDVFRRLQESSTIENVLNDPAKAAAQPGVAALVNGEPVAIDRVRDICVERHGDEVLEILITRKLLEQALVSGNHVIAQPDIDAEIGRAAESMGFKKPDGTPDAAAWIQRVTREEKVPLRHYLEDVVWPTVALKKLVGSVPVSQEDLDRAYAATFGPRARCRIIVLDSQRRAQEVWQLARQNPTAEHVGSLAEQYSVDPTTKALRGEVPPIRRWGGQPALEKEAFALKPGELSGVVQIADRFMVLFCEAFTAPAQVSPAEVRDELFADIFEKKQRIEMARHFTHLREGAAIDNFLAGTSQSPVKQLNGPGVGQGMPGATLARSEAEELAAPRAGSRVRR